MNKASLAKKIISLGMELKILQSQVKKLELKKGKNQKKFANLYGTWKKFGDFTYREIKEAEIKLPNEL